MIINGVELEFNAYEVETAKRFVAAQESVYDDLAKYAEGGDLVPMLETICASIKNAFDYLFGAGTGVKVCGTADDTEACVNAFADLMEEHAKQTERVSAASNRLLSLMGAEN